MGNTPVYAHSVEEARYLDSLDGKLDGKVGRNKIKLLPGARASRAPPTMNARPRAPPLTAPPQATPGVRRNDPRDMAMYSTKKNRIYAPDKRTAAALDMEDGVLDGKYYGAKIKPRSVSRSARGAVVPLSPAQKPMTIAPPSVSPTAGFDSPDVPSAAGPYLLDDASQHSYAAYPPPPDPGFYPVNLLPQRRLIEPFPFSSSLGPPPPICLPPGFNAPSCSFGSSAPTYAKGWLDGFRLSSSGAVPGTYVGQHHQSLHAPTFTAGPRHDPYGTRLQYGHPVEPRAYDLPAYEYGPTHQLPPNVSSGLADYPAAGPTTSALYGLPTAPAYNF